MKRIFLSRIFFAQYKSFNNELTTKLSEPRSNFMRRSEPFFIFHLNGLLILKTQNIKGKTVPLQAWSGPDGSRKLRFPDYMTMAQDGGKVVNLTHRPPLPPRNAPGTHFC
jgi:hypothetical protein